MIDKINITTDLLVIGNGLAGIRSAQAAAQKGINVVVVSKGMSASPEVMGFNAVVSPDDSVDSYYNDIIRSGKGINNRKVARVLAEGASDEVIYLEKLGLAFDKNPDGSYHTLHTLGCDHPRLVHCKAITGVEARRILVNDAKKNGVKFMQHVMITELILNKKCIAGAVGLEMTGNLVIFFRCKAVVLATGGCGDIYDVSTYPSGIVGDGYAIAFRAGAELIDMEFQQYEPCCFVYPKVMRGRLIPTTLFRSGAKLLNGSVGEFIDKYGLTRNNVQKSDLSRAIAMEILEGRGTEHGGVYYDMTMLPRDLVVVNHSIFYNPALKAGIDLTKQKAEVAPAAHTSLGGIRIDEYGSTTVKGLFAAGEVTGGVHGSNRIGGCAGAETLVFGGKAGESAAVYVKNEEFISEKEFNDNLKIEIEKIIYRQAGDEKGSKVAYIRRKLAQIMTEKAGIVRNGKVLSEAMEELEKMRKTLSEIRVNSSRKLAALYQCENSVLTAQMQIKASMVRTESRGVFFRTDYPEQRDQIWMKNIIIQWKNGKMEATIKACNGCGGGGEQW
jgi:fumarate reductase (CoM/CoB) subunit A